jgi:hypothetical protein
MSSGGIPVKDFIVSLKQAINQPFALETRDYCVGLLGDLVQ